MPSTNQASNCTTIRTSSGRRRSVWRFASSSATVRIDMRWQKAANISAAQRRHPATGARPAAMGHPSAVRHPSVVAPPAAVRQPVVATVQRQCNRRIRRRRHRLRGRHTSNIRTGRRPVRSCGGVRTWAAEVADDDQCVSISMYIYTYIYIYIHQQ